MVRGVDFPSALPFGRRQGPVRPPPTVSAKPLHRSRPGSFSALPREYVAGVLLVAAVAGAVATAVFWSKGTPPEPADLGGRLTSLGQVAGLLASYVMLIEVALMARIPWLERAIGTDWLTGAHRRVGEYVIVLLLAHVSLIILGYAGGSWGDVVQQTNFLVLHTPYILFATIGLGLFVLIGITSLKAIRRRMPYELWQYVHLLVYAAIVLAFTHQFTSGSSFVENYPARLTAIGLYIAVGAAVIAFRVLRPLRFNVRHRLRVAAVIPESGGVVSIYVEGRQLRRLDAEPGQFFRWRFLTRGGWWQSHPFSLSAAPNREWLRITVGAIGDHTSALQRLRPGVRVIAEGPYGVLTAALRTRKKVLLLAGGIGITPLRALIDALPGVGQDIVLLYRASRPEDVVFHEELRWLEESDRLSIHYLFGPRDAVPAPLSAERLADVVPDLTEREIFLCGPPGMVDAAERALKDARVRQRRIHRERFTM